MQSDRVQFIVSSLIVTGALLAVLPFFLLSDLNYITALLAPTSADINNHNQPGRSVLPRLFILWEKKVLNLMKQEVLSCETI